ncbi:hypothetical protein HPB49_008933 [Dermacentor silvarum]|uniref:Uncharacterized protein n=1 Tax=Dermacentor silvarum TaxID=543639 RepID=A0ACB8DIP4_DERSI|nr:hypothetical protein HPB49_008933 [Dermacentor silvarum]
MAVRSDVKDAMSENMRLMHESMVRMNEKMDIFSTRVQKMEMYLNNTVVPSLERMSSQHVDDAGGLIEGVGNEVLFTVPVVAAVVVGLLGFAGWQQLRQLSSWSPAELPPPRRVLTREAQQWCRSCVASSRTQQHGSTLRIRRTVPICLAEPRHRGDQLRSPLLCSKIKLEVVTLTVVFIVFSWVSVMLRCFQDQHLADETDAQREERARLLRDINDYNRRYSGEPRPVSDDTLWQLV